MVFFQGVGPDLDDRSPGPTVPCPNSEKPKPNDCKEDDVKSQDDSPPAALRAYSRKGQMTVRLCFPRSKRVAV